MEGREAIVLSGSSSTSAGVKDGDTIFPADSIARFISSADAIHRHSQDMIDREYTRYRARLAVLTAADQTVKDWTSESLMTPRSSSKQNDHMGVEI